MKQRMQNSEAGQMSTLSNLAAKHWVIGGMAVSLLWFVAGRQSLSNRRLTQPSSGSLWRS
jgi:hypothetical protein